MTPSPTNLRPTQPRRVPTPSHPATWLPSRPTEIVSNKRPVVVTGHSGWETLVTQPQTSLTLAAESARCSTACGRVGTRLLAVVKDGHLSRWAPSMMASTLTGPAAPRPFPSRSPDVCKEGGRAPEKPRGETPTHRRVEADGRTRASRRVLLPAPTCPPPSSAPRMAEAQPHPAPRLPSAPHGPALSRVCVVSVTLAGSLCGRPRGRKWRQELVGGPRPSCSPPRGDPGTRLALPVSRPRPPAPISQHHCQIHAWGRALNPKSRFSRLESLLVSPQKGSV